MHHTTFIDVKSESLRDTLRSVLQGVRSISLVSEKPEVGLPALSSLYNGHRPIFTDR